MLSAIVRTTSAPGALAFTLAGLVPAVAEGLMSHAVVLARASDGDVERIADAMGASFVVSPKQDWRAGAEAARGSWLLLLDAGDSPDDGWIGAMERHLMMQVPPELQAAFLPLRQPLGRLRATVSLLRPGARTQAGLLAPRDMVLQGELNATPTVLPATRSRA